MHEVRSPLVLALIVAVVLLVPVPVHAVTIPSGFDWFITQNARVSLDGIDGHPATPALDPVLLKKFDAPNALFDPGAIPGPTFDIQWVDRHGNSVGPDSVHKVGTILTPGPPPPPGTYDTIVHRLTDVTPTVAGAALPIGIVFLSLMSTEPVSIVGVPGLFDLYVGLDPSHGPVQQNGRMVLRCFDPRCEKGTADIGLLGEASDNPADPDFLGLPVRYDVFVFPTGTPPNRLGGPALTDDSVFHTESFSDPAIRAGGRWSIPEPSSLVLLAVGSMAVLGLCRKREG
jgi:hypothetical protein